MLALRTDLVQAHPDAVRSLLKAYFRGLQFTKDHPGEAYKIYADVIDTTPADVQEQLRTIKLADPADSVSAFAYSGGYGSIYNNMQSILQFIGRTDPRAIKLNSDILVDPQFIRALFGGT